jgi:hypothetical protein
VRRQVQSCDRVSQKALPGRAICRVCGTRDAWRLGRPSLRVNRSVTASIHPANYSLEWHGLLGPTAKSDRWTGRHDMILGEWSMSLFRPLILGVALATASFASVAWGEEDAIVDVLIESASTPAQHQALANYYKAKAADAKKEAADHRAMAKSYGSQKATLAAAQAEHCNKLASLSDGQAAEYDQLAAAHEAAAKK